MRGTALLALASCLPESPPPWQVDHTIVAALRVEVAERGPWAAEPEREGLGLAEVMPGDEIRPVPFVIGPDGPVDVAELQPRFFYCVPQRCVSDTDNPGGVRDCGEEEAVPPVSTCEILGGTLRLGALRVLQQNAAIFMVASTGEGPSTDECVRRLRGEAGALESLRECMLRVEFIQLGPTWRLLVVAALSGLVDSLSLSGITPAVTATEPNLFPREPQLTVRVMQADGSARTETLASGATVAVDRGAQVVVTAEVDPEDAQPYWFLDSSGAFSPGNETLSIGWLFSRYVDWTTPDVLSIAWEAPAEPGPTYLYALLGDGDVITPAWLRFEVEPQ